MARLSTTIPTQAGGKKRGSEERYGPGLVLPLVPRPVCLGLAKPVRPKAPLLGRKQVSHGQGA
jgi:hypothetical protein